jgi:hypothetical protein
LSGVQMEKRSANMALPDFFIIGAAKAGTTSLYALLDRHPDIFMPKVKEPEFFARDDRYSEGIETYAAAFADATPDQIVGEASTIYSIAPFFPDTAARVKTHVPEAKLIYVLRHPVDRAYSFYTQLIKNYQNVTKDTAVNRTFEEFVLPEQHARAASKSSVFSRATSHFPDVPELCLAGSDYVLQIEAYLAHFRRDQMLFLKFEDFVRDRSTVVRQITDFLGVQPLDETVFDEAAAARNVSKTHFNELGETVALSDLRQRSGAAWSLRHLLPQSVRARAKQMILGKHPHPTTHIPPKMLTTTRTQLENRFGIQTERLRQLTGLKFEDWGM